ncbi:type II toxin-antitoxin system RelE/ParE family toxin [Candidatus Kuenenia sp.]|uniref:type II toxin-antitoxin system RelE/ParE family toxin n=1 Tax=Candidatus Kuenenia sp. TaxID=2499824 RepID=UPI003220A13B
MKQRAVFLLKEATVDLEEGRLFYDLQEKGVGDYFFDCLISDLESLKFYSGIHSKKFGFYRMFSKRFPFAIYYEIDKDIVEVVAILDMRRNQSLIQSKLGKRKS